MIKGPNPGLPEEVNRLMANGSGPGKWAVMGLVACGTFMTTLDGSIVNIGLPSIARAFRTPLTGTVEWVVIGYLVTIAAVLLSFGRLSDMIGRRPVWVAGLIVFTVGSALCGFAPSLPLLIASRALQGIGGALIFAPSIALLTDAFPEQERGKALGLNAVVVSLGVSTGPPLGGLLTQQLDWRWIFFVNLPIGIVAAFLSFRTLPKSQGKKVRFDFAGAAALAVGLAGVTLAMSFGQEWGWFSAGTLASAGVGVAALGAAYFVERRAEAPIVDLNLFKDRVFASGIASLVMTFMAFFSVGFLMPFYFEQLRGFSTESSGLLLTPFSIAVAVIAPIAGAVADRTGVGRWPAFGLAIAAVGVALVSFVDARTSVWDVIWRTALTGAGVAIFQSPNNSAIMGAAPKEQKGSASGILATARVVGQSLSVAVAGAIFTGMGSSNAGTVLQAQRARLAPADLQRLGQTFLSGFHPAMLTSAAFALAGAGFALIRSSKKEASKAEGVAGGHPDQNRPAVGRQGADLGPQRQREAGVREDLERQAGEVGQPVVGPDLRGSDSVRVPDPHRPPVEPPRRVPKPKRRRDRAQPNERP